MMKGNRFSLFALFAFQEAEQRNAGEEARAKS